MPRTPQLYCQFCDSLVTLNHAEAPAGEAARVTPAARRLLAESGLDAAAVKATGPGGRLLKEDVQRHLEAAHDAGKDVETPSAPPAPEPSAPSPAAPLEAPLVTERHTREPMSRLRQRIAERLVWVM